MSIETVVALIIIAMLGGAGMILMSGLESNQKKSARKFKVEVRPEPVQVYEPYSINNQGIIDMVPRQKKIDWRG